MNFLTTPHRYTRTPRQTRSVDQFYAITGPAPRPRHGLRTTAVLLALALLALAWSAR